MILDKKISASITTKPAANPEKNICDFVSSYSVGKAKNSDAGINTESNKFTSPLLISWLMIFFLPR